MTMPEENQPKTADNDPLLESVAEEGRDEERSGNGGGEAATGGTGGTGDEGRGD
ncbi:hypothetical protein [Planomonospora sphaerica]|nr:hypothetical protein [Planomonospora sphaerica]